MKREKIVGFLWSVALSFTVSFSAIACMVTAFDMGVELRQAALWCAISSFFCSVCFSLPLGLVPVCVGAVAGGYLWQNGELLLSLEALLNRLSRQYDRAYGWGIIRWGLRTADDMEPTMILCLCILGAVIAMAVAWSVCRSKTAAPGVLLAMLPLATCFVVIDTVPDTLWLYFAMLGILVLMLTGAARRQDSSNGNRLGVMVALPAALALLLLFVLVPKDKYNGQDNAKRLADAVLNSDSMQLFMGQVNDSGAIGAGSDSATVDLKSVGYRVESETKIMEVTAQFDGTVYLRGRAMDSYDGVSWWDNSQENGISALSWPASVLEDAGEVSISTRYAHRMLYAPYYVSTKELREVTLGIENEKRLTDYSFSCLKLPEGGFFKKFAGVTQEVSSWGDVPLREYTGLSENVENWAVPLANRITSGVAGTYNKAQAIASYVRNSASYDTGTPRMPANKKDFARWFLEDSSTGYCVHFASATAVLLQAAGIPARYVTGYTAQVKAGQTVAVKAAQAHAWVEYWLPGYGWTVLESTPADLTDAQEQTQAMEAVTTDPEVTDETQSQATTPHTQKPDTQEEAVDLRLLWRVLDALAVIGLAIGILEGQYRLRRYLWNRRCRRGSTNDQAVARWQETVRLARLLGQSPDKELFELAQKAKFSQYSTEQEQLDRFDDYAAAAAATLKKRSVFHRLWYRYILAAY